MAKSQFLLVYRFSYRPFEAAFRELEIPYFVAKITQLFDRKEVKDLMAYVRLLLDEGDDSAFRRAANEPARGCARLVPSKLKYNCNVFAILRNFYFHFSRHFWN